jgi:hypothetical protein
MIKGLEYEKVQEIIDTWTKDLQFKNGKLSYYQHFIQCHLWDLIVSLKSEFNVSLAQISGEGLEHSHKLHGHFEKRGIATGGKANKPRELQILERQFRRLFMRYERQHLLQELKTRKKLDSLEGYLIDLPETIGLTDLLHDKKDCGKFGIPRFGFEAMDLNCEDFVEYELNTRRALYLSTWKRATNKKKEKTSWTKGMKVFDNLIMVRYQI